MMGQCSTEKRRELINKLNALAGETAHKANILQTQAAKLRTYAEFIELTLREEQEK